MTLLIRPEGPHPDDLKISRRLLGGLFFAGYASAAAARTAQPVVTGDEGLITGEVAYPAPDGFDLPAYVARPAGDGPFPLVVVVSEIFGVHAYIQDVCRRLAHQGYAAVAPAFFVRAGDPAPLTDMAEVQAIVAQAGYEQVMGDVSATLEWLGGQIWADSDRVGITGFCWGGKVVWQAVARFAAFDAGVAWYGRLAPAEGTDPAQGAPWPVDLAGDLKAPVLGLYAEEDRGIPLESVEAMRAALARAGDADSEIIVYPGAGHAFHADYRPSYQAQAAEDGWRRLLDHFQARLVDRG